MEIINSEFWILNYFVKEKRDKKEVGLD